MVPVAHASNLIRTVENSGVKGRITIVNDIDTSIMDKHGRCPVPFLEEDLFPRRGGCEFCVALRVGDLDGADTEVRSCPRAIMRSHSNAGGHGLMLLAVSTGGLEIYRW